MLYYDYRKLLSYNALISFVIGERGVGKTYGAIKFAISDFLKNGHQFVYVRRYATELETLKIKNSMSMNLKLRHQKSSHGFILMVKSVVMRCHFQRPWY